MEEINITDLDKAFVLAALYNNARPQGMGHLQYKPESMSPQEAQTILDTGQTYFDYLKGRVMKVQLKGNSFNPVLYDRDNGTGAAMVVIESLRGK